MAAFVLTGWTVLGVLMMIVGLGRFYLSGSGDWRGAVYGGVAALGIIGARLMTARARANRVAERSGSPAPWAVRPRLTAFFPTVFSRLCRRGIR